MTLNKLLLIFTLFIVPCWYSYSASSVSEQKLNATINFITNYWDTFSIPGDIPNATQMITVKAYTDGIYQFIMLGRTNQNTSANTIANSIVYVTNNWTTLGLSPPTIDATYVNLSSWATAVFYYSFNKPPIISISGTKSIPVYSSTTLTAKVTDDGLPFNTLTYTWSKSSGSGNISWTSLSALSTTATFSQPGTFTLRCTANDGGYSAYTDYRVTVTGTILDLTNQVPLLTITSPTNLQEFTAPAEIPVIATATDTDGYVREVEFKLNTTPVAGLQSVSTWTNVFSAIPAGSYVITATAVDDRAGKGSSAVIPIVTVLPAAYDGTATVSITSPTNLDIFTSQQTNPLPMVPILLSADATATYSISNVVFYIGSDPVITDTATPFEGWWSAPVGSFTNIAVVQDVSGLMATSSVVVFSVTNQAVLTATNNPPIITWITPQDGYIYTLAAGKTVLTNLDMRVTVSDYDGSIASVTYYTNAVAGTVDTGPYTSGNISSGTASNLIAGTYTLQAMATDDGGAVTYTPVLKNYIQLAPITSLLVNAGVDQTIAYGASATLTGWTSGSTSDKWSLKSFYKTGTTTANTNAIATFVNSTKTNTTVSFNTNGTATLSLIGYNNSVGILSDDTVITILPPTPTLVFSAPTNNAEFEAPVTIPITAVASANATNIYIWFNNTILASTASATTLSTTKTFTAPTSVVFQATMLDSWGQGLAVYVTNTVTGGHEAPTVTLSDPGTQTEPATFNITATATPDTGGTIASVEFFTNSVSVGTLTFGAPWTWTFTAIPAGTFDVTAKATDGWGVATTSSARPILIQTAAPTIPTVNAGPDQIVYLPSTATLAGSSINSDSVLWSVVTGSGVSFNDATLANATVTFQSSGSYTLRLTAIGTSANATDDISITVYAAQQPSGNIVLPIYLSGGYNGVGPNVVQSRTFSLTGITPSANNYMQIRDWNVKSSGNVSFQVNSSPIYTLNNATMTVLGNAVKGLKHGGAFATMWEEKLMPANTFVNGQNTITFYHNRKNDATQPMTLVAIIGLQVRDASNNTYINTNSWSWQDPITGPDYLSPLTSTAAVNEGKSLMQTKNFSPSTVSCNGCHIGGGSAISAANKLVAWDMAYFAYPYSAVVGSARSGGWSEEEANKAYAWVDYMKKTYASAYPWGRIWNPPFQPGPGLDSKDAIRWIAGAGIDAVYADTDENVLVDQMFPNGITYAAVTNAWAAPTSTSAFNCRHQQLPIELPGIINWIPSEHPKDIWGSTFTSHALWKDYIGTQNNNGYAGISGAYSAAAMPGAINPSIVRYAYEQWHDSEWNSFNNTTAKSGAAGNRTKQGQVSNLALWHISKTLELYVDRNTWAYPLNSTYSREYRELYDRSYFDIAPNILTQNNDYTGLRDESTAELKLMQSKYWSVAWYQVQLILNPGNYKYPGYNRTEIRPMDWPYCWGFFNDMSCYFGMPNAAMFMQNNVKAWHSQENTPLQLDDATNGDGWSPQRNCSLSWLMRKDIYGIWNYSNITVTQRKAFMNAMLQYWIEQSSLFTPAEYYATGWASDASFNAATVDPNNPPYAPNGLYVLPYDIWLLAIPGATYYGVDSTLKTQLKDWCATIWPSTDWANRN